MGVAAGPVAALVVVQAVKAVWRSAPAAWLRGLAMLVGLADVLGTYLTTATTVTWTSAVAAVVAGLSVGLGAIAAFDSVKDGLGYEVYATAEGRD